MPKFNFNPFSHFLFFILGSLAGLLGFFLFNKYKYLNLSNQISLEVNPLELLFVIINVLLAVYVTRNLSKKNDQERLEKELIIKFLEEFRSEYNERITKLLALEDFEDPTTKSSFKALRQKINSCISLAKEYNVIKSDDIVASEITEIVTDAWELLTDTPKAPSSRANQATKDGVQALRLEKISKIEQASNKLNKLIFKLAMIINQK